MDFELTETQRALQTMSRDFAARHFEPICDEYEEEEKPPLHLFQELAALNLLGANIPQELGGMGLDTVSLTLITKELARVWPAGTLSLFMVQNSLVVPPLVKYGTPLQQELYLKTSMSAERRGCFCLTEPGYGSHASGVKSAAALVDDKLGIFHLRGDKTFITNVTFADFAIVLARTRQPGINMPEYDGLTAFIVSFLGPKERYQIRQISKHGLHSSLFGQIHFENTPVLKLLILGEEGKGYKVFMDTLQSGRAFIMAQAWGVAEAAFEAALDYARTREQFGKPLIDHQAVGHMLADMATDVKTAALWTMHVAWLKDRGMDYRKTVSMGKALVTDIALRVAERAVEIYGGIGYTREKKVRVGRYLADAVAFRIYEGANLIQKNIVASELKKGK